MTFALTIINFTWSTRVIKLGITSSVHGLLLEAIQTRINGGLGRFSHWLNFLVSRSNCKVVLLTRFYPPRLNPATIKLEDGVPVLAFQAFVVVALYRDFLAICGKIRILILLPEWYSKFIYCIREITTWRKTTDLWQIYKMFNIVSFISTVELSMLNYSNEVHSNDRTKRSL